MSQQKGVLVLFNKEENKYYTYKVEMTNGQHLKVFSDGRTPDIEYKEVL